jgi:hypothetical protein
MVMVAAVVVLELEVKGKVELDEVWWNAGGFG